VVYQKYVIRGRENGKEGGGGRGQLTHVQRKRESKMRKRGEEGERKRDGGEQSNREVKSVATPQALEERVQRCPLCCSDAPRRP